MSSSAFERLLDSSKCTDPISLGRRLDPKGSYVKRYVPELANYPPELIHEPWKASREQQTEYGCVIGEHYPAPMVDLAVVGKRNAQTMASLRENLVADGSSTPPHCRPSDIDEIRQFFWLSDDVVPEA